MKKFTRILSVLLALCMLLTLAPATFAEEAGSIQALEIKIDSTQRVDENGVAVGIPAYITLPANYDPEQYEYPLVVMIHGHGGNHNEWGGYDAISNDLAEEEVIAVTLDFPGCGASTESFQLNTMTNMKNDVLDVLNYMTANYAVDTAKVGAFGYSMGGRIILEMIVEDMYDFATIELVAPGEDTEDLKDLFGGAEAWETMKTEANEKGYVEFTTIYGQTQELSKEWFEDLEKYQEELVELAAPKYEGETLVVWCTQDEAVRPHVSENVANVMGAVKLLTYDAGGHSYSFYGNDPYTVGIVNGGSVNWFVNELQRWNGEISGYVANITADGSMELTIEAAALEAAGIREGDELEFTVMAGDEGIIGWCTYGGVQDNLSDLIVNGDGTLTLVVSTVELTNTFAQQDEEGNWIYTVPAETPLTVALEPHYSDETVILYTNDVHTYIDGDLSYDTIAALKAETAGQGADVLLLDAGDHIQGTAYGSMDDGETIIKLMNAAGYDLATLGNHEFDYGMQRILDIMENEAEYPYISANFYNEKDGVVGDTVLDAYKIYELGGKKIAFVGITTPETFTKSTPKYFQDENGNYIYGIAGGDDGADLYATVQTAIDAAKAEGAEIIIALGHLGDDPASQPWTSEELIANTTGLDAFIDGHSHSTVEEKTVLDESGRPVVLTQTGEYFNAIGRMSISANGISVDLITEYKGYDPKVRALKDAWISEVDQLLGEKIAVSEVDFRIYGDEGRLIRKQETNLGDFTADALYYLFDVTEGLDVDCAIMNGGGIRADMPAGDLSYKSTKTVHTFGNVACLITVTGQQILDALEWGARNVGVGENGGFLQVSGITYEIHSYIESTVQMDDKGVWTGGPTGEYRVKNVTIGGEPLDVTATYNMAGYNYTLRDLGDGFAMFGGAVNVKDYVMEDYLVLANYAKSFPVENGYPTIKADNSVLGANYGDINGEGRIKIVAEEESEPITFTDVKETDWFYEFVMEAAEEGYIIGYPDGTFLPNKNVTRAEFAEMLYRAMGGPAELPEGVESSFADVTENQWYYVSVTMLAEAGIIVGRDEDTFDPNATITREEMVTILYRVYKLGYGEDAETPDQSVLEAFTDSAAISDYAVDAFAWAIEWGAIEGMGDNTLAPKGRTTRAQAATVLTRLD